MTPPKEGLRPELFIALCWSQCTALQFQVNLHLLFLHDFLQFCGSSGVLEEGEDEAVFEMTQMLILFNL